MDTIQLLDWSTMTSTIDLIKTPNSFVFDLLFGQEEVLSTDTVEVGCLKGDREIAPFVEVNAEAIQVAGYNEIFQVVKAPNIRIKRPMTATEKLYKRRPGSVIFPTREQQLSAGEEALARDLTKMRNNIDDTKEWMACQALQGAISYQVAGGASWKITFPRTSTHNLAVSAAWGGGTEDIVEDFTEAARLISEDAGLQCTDCIMSKEAAGNFLGNTVVQALLDKRNIDAGTLQLRAQFLASGARFLGTFMGIRCWEYGRSVLVNGTPTDLIRAGYVEFVAVLPQAENIVYYASIPDFDAIDQGEFIGRIFAKSWKTPDPSVLWQLAHTRPLTVTRKPDSIVSINTTP